MKQGRYELGEELGRGGMGVVHAAVDTLLRREVAIKTLLASDKATPLTRSLFMREAQMAARLSHPGIVTIYDVFDEDGAIHIVMELVRGMSLKEAVMHKRVASLKLCTEILRGVADALDYAHSLGIVHRDVKIENVLLNDRFKAKIADFGIARPMIGESLTPTGQIMGTKTYFAPECLTGESAGPAADQYALAVTAFLILTGEPPFSGDPIYVLMMNIISTPPPSASSKRHGLNVDVDNVLARGMEKTPSKRFSSCSAFVTSLENALMGTSSPAEGEVRVHHQDGTVCLGSVGKPGFTGVLSGLPSGDGLAGSRLSSSEHCEYPWVLDFEDVGSRHGI